MSAPKKMGTDELASTQEFQNLTAKQKTFVLTYVQSGLDTGNYDQVLATRTAFNCKSEEVARVMSYRLMSNLRVIMCLNLHFGANPEEAFMAVLERAIRRNKISSATASILNLYAEMRFGVRPNRNHGKSKTDHPGVVGRPLGACDSRKRAGAPVIDYGLTELS